MNNALSRRRLRALLPIVVLLMGGCAATDTRDAADAGAASSPETFPMPREIEGNVAFWRKVYAHWSRGQVALHDDEHLALVYEVITLPGPIGPGYTREQRDLIRNRTGYLRARLKRLEARVAAGESLSTDERALLEVISTQAGPRALAGAHERLRVQRGISERFRRGLEISGRYEQAFRDIFRAAGLPEDLAYLPHVESSFQVSARSSAGAAGVWQFTRGTGKLYMNVNGAVDERLDPVIAAEGAARYLQDAYRRLGSWPLAVTSYNHGMGGMARAKGEFGNDLGRIVREYKGPLFGFASRNFYAEFLAAREIASNPRDFFAEHINYRKPLAEDRLILPHSLPVRRIANHYGLSSSRLAELNPAWRAPVRDGRVHLAAGSSLWLPQGTLVRVTSVPAPVPVLVAKADVPANAARRSRPSGTGGGGRLHVVKPNETLYEVALRYDLSVDKLRRLNRLSPRHTLIRPGQRLRVSI